MLENLMHTQDKPSYISPMAERMYAWLLSVEAEGEAKGRARAKAEGELDAIRRLHKSGIIAGPQAITAIRALITEGIVPEDMAQSLIREIEAG